MVSQYANAVAYGSGVDRSSARTSAEFASRPEEALEVRGGQPHCAWICDLPPLDPVQKTAKHSSALTGLWVLISGLTPIALGLFRPSGFSCRDPNKNPEQLLSLPDR